MKILGITLPFSGTKNDDDTPYVSRCNSGALPDLVLLDTSGVSDYPPSPGLVLNGHRDINARQADWLKILGPAFGHSYYSMNIKEETTTKLPGSWPEATEESGSKAESPEVKLGGREEGEKTDPPGAQPQSTTEGTRGPARDSGPTHSDPSPPKPTPFKEKIPNQAKPAESTSKADGYEGSAENSENDGPPLDAGTLNEADLLHIKSLVVIIYPEIPDKNLHKFVREIQKIKGRDTQANIYGIVGSWLVQSLPNDSSITVDGLPTIINVITAILMSKSAISSSPTQPHQAIIIEEDIFSLLSILASDGQTDAVRNRSHLLAHDRTISLKVITTMVEETLELQRANIKDAVVSGIVALQATVKSRKPSPTSNESASSAKSPTQDAPPSSSRGNDYAAPPTANLSKTSVFTHRDRRPPPSNKPSVVAVDHSFAKGKHKYTHILSNSTKDITGPDLEDKDKSFEHAIVFTHWNSTSASWKVWLSPPGIPVWMDITTQWNEVAEVPHPTMPEYSLSRNLTTKVERPNFVQKGQNWKTFREKFLGKYSGSEK